jgi:hypothetical protein
LAIDIIIQLQVEKPVYGINKIQLGVTMLSSLHTV